MPDISVCTKSFPTLHEMVFPKQSEEQKSLTYCWKLASQCVELAIVSYKLLCLHHVSSSFVSFHTAAMWVKSKCGDMYIHAVFGLSYQITAYVV